MSAHELQGNAAGGLNPAGLRLGPPGATYHNFIFDEHRGFVFAYVPKVACTNWKSIMRYLAGFPDYLDPRMAHDRKANGLTYLDLRKDGMAILDDPEIRVYTCVRDPYSRILSAYLDKIERRLPKLHDPEADAGDHFMRITRNVELFRQTKLDAAAYPAMSFEVFMLWLRHSDSPFRGDEHWQTQTVLLRWPTVQFDDIGRFETLEEDSRRILDRMGCEIGFPTQKDVRFPPTAATTRREEYFTPLARSLAGEIYRADFANFGYAP